MQWGGSTPYANDLAEVLSPPTVPERLWSANQVPSGIRLDKYNHWPIQVEGNATRCKMPGCKRKSPLCALNAKCVFALLVLLAAL